MPVGTERDGVAVALMVERQQFLAARHVPDLHRLVEEADRREPKTVGRERETVDSAVVAR